MNIKKIFSIILSSAFIVTLASGCDITDIGTDNMLRPPKTMGDEAVIEQLIADTAKSGYTLKYPQSGNYRSAIIMQDLDDNKSNEAVAFFADKDDTAKIHMLVMYSKDDKWHISSDNITETTDVNRIDFADVDGDGNSEIIVGYSTYSTNISKLNCYGYADGKTSEINSGQNYSSFYCGDFDGDGYDEIMSLLLFTTENEASATMLDYDSEKNSIYSKATVGMDPNVIKYKNVLITKLDDSTNGIIVDGNFATDELDTQIIYYSKDLSLLRNPLYSEKHKNITQRSSSVISSDVDGDGFVEIPIVSKLPHISDDTAQTADKIEWDSFAPKNESLTKKQYMIPNYNYNYTFKMPDKWIDENITAKSDTKKGTMDFYEWNKNKTGDMLFEIKVFGIEDWNIGKYSDGYTLISKDTKYAYAFIINKTDNKLSLTSDEIKTAFSQFTEVVV